MNPKCHACPIESDCNSYPFLCERMAQSPAAYAEILDQVNGKASSVPPAPDPWLPLILACDDHNPGCCAHPAAFCTRYLKNVSREQCIDCLTATGITP